MRVELLLVLDNDRPYNHSQTTPEDFMDEENRYDDWASDIKAKIDKHREEQRLADEKTVAIQKLLAAHAAPLWERVRKEMQDMRNAINKKVEQEVIASDSVKTNEIVFRIASSGITYRATFIPQSRMIEFRGPSLSDNLSASVYQGEVVFFWGANPMPPAEVAKKFMDVVARGLY